MAILSVTCFWTVFEGQGEPAVDERAGGRWYTTSGAIVSAVLGRK